MDAPMPAARASSRGTSRAGAALEKALDDRLADAALRWGSCCDKGAWRDHVAEHGDTARQLEILAERSVEVVSRKGHPARGGPARARLKSALANSQSAQATACLVGSSNKAAASVACHSLNRITALLSASENSTILRACASDLIVPLIWKACKDYRDDTKAALAAATALWRLLGTPTFSQPTPPPTVVTTKTAAERETFELVAKTLDATTANDVTFSSSDHVAMFPELLRSMVCDRLINNAKRGERKGASNAPLAIVAAALAPHPRLWIEAFKDTRRHSYTCQKFAQRLMEVATIDEGAMTTLGSEAALEAAAMLTRDVPAFREQLLDFRNNIDAALGAHLCGNRERPAEVAALHLLTAMATTLSPQVLESSTSDSDSDSDSSLRVRPQRYMYDSDSDSDVERIPVISFEWSAIFKAVVKRADEFPSVIQSRLENKSDEAKEAVPAAAITVVAELLTVAPWKLGEQGGAGSFTSFGVSSGWGEALMGLNIDKTLEACLMTLSKGVQNATGSGRAMSSMFRRGEAVTASVIDCIRATERLVMHLKADMFDEILRRDSSFGNRKPPLRSPNKLHWDELLEYAMNILMIAGPKYTGVVKEDGTVDYIYIPASSGPPYVGPDWQRVVDQFGEFDEHGPVGDNIFQNPELIATAGQGFLDWMAESMATAAGNLLCTAFFQNISRLSFETPTSGLIDWNGRLFGGTNMERGLHFALSMDWPWGYLRRKKGYGLDTLRTGLVSIPLALLATLVSPFIVNEKWNGKDFIPQLHDEKLLHAEQILNHTIPQSVKTEMNKVDCTAANDKDIDAPLIPWSLYSSELMVATLRTFVMLFSVYREAPKVNDPVETRSLREALDMLASEDGGLGDEGRCWAIKALNIHVNRYGEKDIAPVTDKEYVKGPRSRIADALFAALPEPFRQAGGGDNLSFDLDAAMTSSPVAPPDVCFCLADGWRQCAHSVILSARCPVLKRKIEDAIPDERDSAGVHAIKMGAQVTVEGFRRALAWIYSSRVTGPVPKELVSKLELPELRARAFPGIGCVASSLVADLEPVMKKAPWTTDLKICASASVDDDGSDAPPAWVDAHRVILCARSEYCRAALSVRHGFVESGERRASLTLPVTTAQALDMLLRVVYLGEIPAVPKPVPQGVEDKGWAHALVELGSCLEYIGLPAEAARCTPRLQRALADWDVSGEPGGSGDEARMRSVSADGAIKALAAAAELRRWDDVDALAGTLSGAYAEVSGKAEFEALHPELKEAMRRAHVDARHAGVVYRG